ncbi:MAG: SusD/RagB family nutrient-binding outer membrane lipoprotein [Chitinophagaceae bacterium]|nr:SusD/RagB family nutrient-binding outer membrane lipoprotein [Chitinophagaceae bacterium]MCW5927478.1 SusD/RagB family nutrient-binding outer membrane lipoprotein [Chitinophagaceae bacterium]
MKKFNYIYILLLALLAAGCKKGYFDLNENPNQVSKPGLPSLLSTVTHKSGINSYNVASITSQFVQYLAGPAAGGSTDTYQVVDYSGTWDALYYAMADIYDFKQLALEAGSSEYIGVANVLMAYNLSLAADLWGSVPYSEAFQGSNLTPAYDSEQQVYNEILSLLNEAITELSKTDATIKLAPASDMIFGPTGDARPKWLKTAYALKARALIKVSKTAGFDATAVLQALDNAYTGNADDAGMANFQLRNNWASVARSNAALTLGGWLSEQLVDHLNGTTYGVFDPRIEKITDLTVNGIYIGTVNGAGNRPPGNNTVKDECYVALSSPWTGDASPLWLVTFAELKFIEAEAALTSDPGRAYNAYLAGIAANMDKLQVETTKKSAYLAEPDVAVGQGSLTRELIFKEKYVATYLNPEAWNDVRRNDYNYKDFTLPENAVLPSFIRRVAYPNGETSKNGKNVPSVSSLTDRLWWDQ